MDNNRNLRTIASTDVGLLVLLGLAVALLHILVNGRYGFHRDELQTFNNALHLAWGYVEYPPMTAVVGRVELVLCGLSVRGFRFFPALTQGLVFVLTGLVARALGARREAQLVAAVGAVIGGAPLALLWRILVVHVARLSLLESPRSIWCSRPTSERRPRGAWK